MSSSYSDIGETYYNLIISVHKKNKNSPFFPNLDTSRDAKEGEEDGKGYHFVTRNKMTELRRANQFLEFGEYNGNMYGTSIESVRSVIDQHKMCVLDIQPAVRTYLLYSNSSTFLDENTNARWFMVSLCDALALIRP